MASFAHQDFRAVDVGRGTAPKRAATAADKAMEVASAKRAGTAVTLARVGAGGNATASGHGPMGTSAGAKARKLDEETEVFKTARSGLALGKALAAARAAKGLTQKALATAVSEKPQLIQQYESGSAIPQPAVIGKLERQLGVKLPRPTKVKAVKPSAAA